MTHNRDMNTNWSEALANSVNMANTLTGAGRTDHTAEDFPLDKTPEWDDNEPEWDAEMFREAKGFWPEQR